MVKGDNEDCDKELSELRKHWLKKWELRRGSRPYSTFDFFFENRERCIEVGAVLAFLRLKRSDYFDLLEGEDSEMI